MSNQTTPLTELLSFVVDNRGKSVPTVKSGFPLIATNCIKHSSIYPTYENIRYVDQHIKNSWFRAHPLPNDIIFVNKGTPGRVCLVPDPVPFCFAQDMIGFRCDPDKIDYQYLFAVLRSNYIQELIKNYHVGLVIPHFKKGDLDKLLIPRLANRKQELSVGDFYLCLSKKIEINNRINTELEAMAKTLYEYWFVQFDFPDANGKPYKTSGGKMVYNATLKREIPAGWRASNILSLTDLLGGGTPTKTNPEYWNGSIPFFTPTDSDKNIYSLNTQDSITDLGLKNSSTRLFEKNTIFITARGSVGRLALNAVPMAMNQSCYALKAKQGVSFAFLYFLTKELIHHLEVKATGSVFNSIVSNDIEYTNLALPDDIGLIDKYAKKIELAFTKIELLTKENQQLTALRDWLLPLLMNGQVTVK
ncbi:restriction endonuclease subunit S [Escherichia coli]|uniref:restriction endonuclease subunit S n=1 Tax=Escherichia coli TaxID=562 RepID=UPI000CFAAA5C|nr:restriction endonuclease subunit S [Escherichia coli]